jgi:uncharacterized protein (DUF305 family)
MDNNTTDNNTANESKRNYVTFGVCIILALVIGGAVGWGLSAALDNGSSDRSVGSLAAKASAAGHNQADVTFTQMMVPHHEQALEMAQLASSRASSADVKALAANIEAAQQPEIDKMNGWLNAWGAESMSGMDHGSMDMGQGMMSQADMDKLKAKSGTAFDHDFLSMMMQHHDGAIAMARTELADGRNANALALAASIQVTQQAEISQMQALLQ